MKSARQVNRNKINGVHYEIPIGRYYPPHNSLKPVLELNYVKVTFDDGKYCPLKGAPRMSHIKFVCADKSKDAMYLVDVVEAPICEYNFIVHVPELCGYLGQYTTAVKRSAKVTCYSESVKEKVGKTAKTPSSFSKSKTPIVGLDNILDLIEKKYKDSSLLLQYKDLVRKAFEQLKADDLSRKLEDETESLSELIKLLFPKDKEQPESEVDAEVEDLKARGK